MSEQELAEELGQVVRAAWVAWARTRPNPKGTWLAAWVSLPEADKEADRQIGLAVARAVERMYEHQPNCQQVMGHHAMENDCSCGLYERRMALRALVESTG